MLLLGSFDSTDAVFSACDHGTLFHGRLKNIVNLCSSMFCH